MAEHRLRVIRDVRLQLLPAILIIPDLFAVCANRDNPLQLPYYITNSHRYGDKYFCHGHRPNVVQFVGQ